MIENFLGITSLALADAVNPCAIAVLTMVLMTLLVENAKDKKRVLYGGFAFISAVYIGYLFYGTIIIQFFKAFAEFSRANSTIVRNGLAIFAMMIGALNVKDFFMYKQGGVLTEMPIFMRPKVKKIIDNIISPKGAFVIGFIVTLFLLPCTMGPLFVAGGKLAEFSFLTSTLLLLYYNLLFVLPMIFIVFLIYYGFSKVEDVSGWKERNIRKLHLISGILLFIVGFALLRGWL